MNFSKVCIPYKWILKSFILLFIVAATSPYTVNASEEREASIEKDASNIWVDPVTGIEFVFIKGGCYLMGSPEKEIGRYDDEIQHRVCVNDFWISRYEVTNAQFRSFVEDADYVTTGEEKGEGFGISSKEANDWGWKKGVNWKHPLWPGDTIEDKLNHPVTQVSWVDSKAFVRWLTGKYYGINKFRLPYESEWEYACRGGTRTARYWGNEPEKACLYASIADFTIRRLWPQMAIHNCSDSYATTAPVGTFLPNNWGLYDMLGNVWEWTEDTYASYGRHTAKKPFNVEDGPLRVLRGGSWIYGPRHVRCAFRNVASPTGRSYSTGFRILKEK